MTQVGSLTVDLIAQTASFNANIEKAARNLNSSAARMTRSLDQIKAKTDRLSSGFAALRDVFLTYQVGRFIGEQFRYAASLGETAQQLGITTKQLQVYSALAGQVGVEQADLETSLTKLTSSLGKAALGAETPAKAFDALGISIRKANGDVKTAGDALPEIADKLSKVTDPAQRAAAEVALFGRSGQKLDNILTGGSKGIEDYAKQLEATGQILDDKLIQQADTAADRVEELNRQLKVSVAKTVAENATSILALANALAALTGRAIQFISNYPRLSSALAGAAMGARLGGPWGAAAGAAAGYLGGNSLARSQDDANTDMRFRANALNVATGRMRSLLAMNRTGIGNPKSGPFQAARSELERQRSLMAQAMQANASANLPALPPALDGEDLPSFMAGGGGGGRKTRTPRDRSADYQGEFADVLARLNDDVLSAKRDNLSDIGMISDISRQQLQVETDKLNADITELAAKNPIIKANEDKLRDLVNQAAAQKQLTISTEELAQRNEELLNVQLAANDNQKDILQAQQSLATTASERLPIALQLLDLDKQEERLRLQAIIDRARIGQATAAEAQAAEARMGKLDQMYGLRAEGVRRDNESPIQRYLRDINKTDAEMNEAFQNIAVNGLTSLSDGLADAIVNFKSLGDVAKNVLAQIAADLLRLQIQKAIVGLIGGALGGIGGSVGGIGKAGLKLAMRASGGPVEAGMPYIVGERRPELFVPKVSGMILPRVPQFQAARNDNARPVEAHFHYGPGMSERERRETTGQAMRDLRREMGRSTRMGG